MVFTLYPNKPITEVLSCEDATHIVSVVFNDSHYAVLFYDIGGLTVTVYDGVNVSIKKWQAHIIQTGSQPQTLWKEDKEGKEYGAEDQFQQFKIAMVSEEFGNLYSN